MLLSMKPIDFAKKFNRLVVYEPDVVVEPVVEPPLLVVDVALVLVLVVPLAAVAASFFCC